MVRTPALLAMLGLLTVACNEYEIIEDPDARAELEDNAVPDIEVSPTQVDYGQLEVGVGAEQAVVVTVQNVGEGDLHIIDVLLDDPSAPYDIGAIGSVLVPPEQSTTFTVTYIPETSAVDTASVLIESDDPDEPTVPVTLLGEGIAPVVDVTPTEYDFGTLYIGCDNLQPVTISNVGNADLSVESFDFTSASTDLIFDASEDLNGALPWTVVPGAAVQVWVEYAPIDEYQDVGYLYVNSNDPFQPSVLAQQSGLGELYGENTDVYEQPIEGQTDIMFSMDFSCSMYDNISNVLTNFEVFIETLASMDADYHVTGVTADNGCVYSGGPTYIDTSYSEEQQKTLFDDMINKGGYGSNTERLFSIFESALKNGGEGDASCNSGFYREDATLNLVAVSDEPEQSPNSYTYYVSLFQSLKDDTDDLVMHAIAGDYPSGCGGGGGGADYGAGYYEASLATGGTFLSICATDFGSHLETLAEGSAQALNAFGLSDTPVPETIAVKIDGITTTVGWSYNATDNAVEFESDYVPEGGSTVEINYAVKGGCDQ